MTAICDSFKFITVGDWGSGRLEQWKVADSMANYVHNNNVSFILTLGDNFYEDGVESIYDKKWIDTYENVYLSHDELRDIPWYVTLGNHDYHGNVTAQIDFSNYHNNWKLPNKYYSFEKSNTNFFILDTQTLSPSCAFDYPEAFLKNLLTKGITKRSRIEQYNWIYHSDLHKSRWTIVAGHVGIYSVGNHDDCDSLISDLFPYLRSSKNMIYIHGHEHIFQHNRVNEVDMFGIGTSGLSDSYRNIETNLFSSSEYGFGVITVNDNMLTVEFINMENNIIYSTTKSYIPYWNIYFISHIIVRCASFILVCMFAFVMYLVFMEDKHNLITNK